MWFTPVTALYFPFHLPTEARLEGLKSVEHKTISAEILEIRILIRRHESGMMDRSNRALYWQ